MASIAYSGDYKDRVSPTTMDRNNDGDVTDQEDWYFYSIWTYLGYASNRFIYPENDFQGNTGADKNVFHCPVTKTMGIRRFPLATSPGTARISYGYNYIPAAVTYEKSRGFTYASWNNIRSFALPINELLKPGEAAYSVEATTSYLRHWEYRNEGLLPHQQNMNVAFWDGHGASIRSEDIEVPFVQPEDLNTFWNGIN